MITIPTLNELYLSIKGDLEASESITIPVFGKSVIRIIASVQAAKLKLIYLAIGNLQKNIFVDTADSETKGGTLERFGRVKLGRDPFPPRAAQYTVSVTGTTGAVVPASSTFKSSDTSLNAGVLFILDTAHTLIASTDVIIIRALNAGLDSKLEIGDKLSLTAPVALVDKEVSVTIETIQPLAAESLEDYRTKILNSFRLEAQGGAATDYRLWSSDAQGVERVYPYAKSGFTSEIDLYVEATIADSTDGKGTPSSMTLTDVEAVVDFNPDITLALNERGRRPVTAIVNYLPVTIKNVDIEIVGFVGNTAAITEAILSALTSSVGKVRPFVASADILDDKNDIIDINKIIAVILTVRPGAIFTSVTLKIDTVTVSTFTFMQGNIPYLNSVTYL